MNPRIKLLSHRYRNSQSNGVISIETPFKHPFRSNKQSPEFRSKVTRSFDYGNHVSPGPGEYEVSLPLVRPNIQAIQKNKNSIIVKIHQRNTPAFQSLEPRFKQPKNHYEYESKVESLGSSNQQQMIHKSKKSIHPKAPQHWRSINPIPSIQSYTVDVKNNKKDNINRQQSIKGTEWSKYLSGRRQWMHQNSSQAPGPGFYGYAKIKQTQYVNPHNSWQFRSSTLREAFDTKTKNLPNISSKQSQLQNFQRTACIHSLMRQ